MRFLLHAVLALISTTLILGVALIASVLWLLGLAAGPAFGLFVVVVVVGMFCLLYRVYEVLYPEKGVA